jgi:hypothetical protein
MKKSRGYTRKRSERKGEREREQKKHILSNITKTFICDRFNWQSRGGWEVDIKE